MNMPIIVPACATSFADATNTEGGALGKYVIAQFRGDARLDWVQRLRSMLGVDELKYGNIQERRPKLKLDRELWGQIENGVGQATIIVSDPAPFYHSSKFLLEQQGAKENIDFSKNDLIQRSSIAILDNTPIAYMPFEMMRLSGFRGKEVARLDAFSPLVIQTALGNNLRKAKVFAARAHAMFDTPAIAEHVSNLNNALRSPAATVLLAEILSTSRVFDEEEPKSIDFLNSALEEMAISLSHELPIITRRGKISEAKSQTINELQAADVAAGWAREIIDISGSSALANKFERVWINGERLK